MLLLLLDLIFLGVFSSYWAHYPWYFKTFILLLLNNSSSFSLSCITWCRLVLKKLRSVLGSAAFFFRLQLCLGTLLANLNLTWDNHCRLNILSGKFWKFFFIALANCTPVGLVLVFTTICLIGTAIDLCWFDFEHVNVCSALVKFHLRPLLLLLRNRFLAHFIYSLSEGCCLLGRAIFLIYREGRAW